MRKALILTTCAIGVLVLGCTGTKVDQAELEKAKAAYQDASTRLEHELQVFAQATKEIMAPLQGLDEKEMAAVAALLVMRENMASMQAMDTELKDGFVKAVNSQLVVVSPSLAYTAGRASIHGACLDESIAYASALANCEKEGKEEDECPQAWVAGAAEIDCVMKALEGSRGFIVEIFGDLEPPLPIPGLDR
ncbi:MAG: hypothetical protein JSV44_08270 [Candidatus Zixiibacteriota bacterium]|nr:MAG: hypothetical protein JSV44_08270 [candidate division Zixibacteria bacterium]